MIALLGDIHGEERGLRIAMRKANEAGAAALIQVGDFGVSSYHLDALKVVASESRIPIYFIDGNHEDYRIITSWRSEVDGWDEARSMYRVAANLIYVPRGVTLTIDGKRIAFLGGAGSIDYAYRKAGRTWWPVEEQIHQQDADVLMASGPVDLLVTHTPPRSFIDKFFDVTPERARQSRAMFGAAPDWTDPSSDKVEAVWQALGKPPLYCGHMHRSIRDNGVYCLAIDELAEFDKSTQCSGLRDKSESETKNG